MALQCPRLVDLPPSPPTKRGWPWTEETLRPSETFPGDASWPRISIVTPCYNQSGFIEETIRSVLLQGYPNLEYVVIDGGSTDGSVEIIRKYASWLTYWVSEPDHGQSHAINKGLARCTGDLITFQNSDDIYLPGTFFDVANLWIHREETVGAVVGGFHFMDSRSQISSRYYPPILCQSGPVDLTLGPPGIYRLHQVATFYSREALDKVGRFVREDLLYVMDRELLYRVSRKYPFILANRGYGAFRKHDASKSVSAILPFAREFAQLYLESCSSDGEKDRKRRAMARYHLARGFRKYAKSTNRRLIAAWALLRALVYMPEYVTQRGYFSAWIDALRLQAVAKLLK